MRKIFMLLIIVLILTFAGTAWAGESEDKNNPVAPTAIIFIPSPDFKGVIPLVVIPEGVRWNEANQAQSVKSETDPTAILKSFGLSAAMYPLNTMIPGMVIIVESGINAATYASQAK